tara:strand:- start:269 stop:1492 length:1224 start_codon:yes stop_codon:yes gene_type:complete
MVQESFIKKLLDRRVPQILGSYLVAATSLVLFVEYLVAKYQFADHYPILALFSIIGILPTVIILAYFHGAPGKDIWTKVEKIAIPINVVFITVCLLFGDYFSLWDISSSQKRHVFYIGSLDGKEKYVKDFAGIKDAIAENGETEILFLNEQELDEISLKLESNLINEFYNQNTHIEILNNEIIHSFVDSLSTVTAFYDYTNQPDQFGFIYIYKVENSDSINYLAFSHGWVGNPKNGNNWRYELDLEDKTVLKNNLTEILSRQIKHVNNKQANGFVTQIDDNIIIINPNDLNLKKHMIINGATRYILKDNNENGKIDLDEGLKKLLDDINSAIEYAENHPLDYTEGIISDLHEQYQRWSNYYGTADMTKDIFGYSLKVVEVTESKVVAKLLELRHPWVKIREGDIITP